jgi:hypothetical protein
VKREVVMAVLEQTMKQDNAAIAESCRSSRDTTSLINGPVKELPFLPQTVIVEEPFLSSHQVDVLADAECDWMSLLHPNWQINLSSCRLLGVEDEVLPNTAYLSISNLVPLTLKAPYQSIIVYEQTYWTYTFCSQVIGLGRVRIVIKFDNPQLIGEYTVLVTNRLAWSPRRILEGSQYFHL